MQIARVFVTVFHFHPSLIFASKVETIREGVLKCPTMVGSSLACKYDRRMEVNGNGKHFS